MTTTINVGKNIGGRKFVISCDAEYAEQADDLLAYIKEFQEQGRPLGDGDRIRFGWSLLTLREKASGGEIEVLQPDFLGDPFHEVSSDLTITLQVLSAQVGFIKSLKFEPEEIFFADKIFLSRNCLDEARIYLERKDFGWFIGSMEQDDDEQVDSIYLYQLVQLRPMILPMLSLPMGYMVELDGNRLKRVLDPENEALSV